MEPVEKLARRIAFAGYRNMNLGTARHFRELGIGEDEFFGQTARCLSSVSGLRESFFDDERRRDALEQGRREAAFVTDHNIAVLYFADDTYPARMADCDDAPAILYGMGKVEETAHVVSIVGTRHCTSYGAEFTRKLVQELGEALDSVLIVSGLAYGIDIAAHRAALACNIPTAAVLAHGMNTIYPADHRDDARRIASGGGYLLTEYPSYAPVHRGNFLARNRIVASLADVTIVVESDVKGGAMTTARIAGAYNREVMALPGRVSDTYSRGCNDLIVRRVASVIRDAGDLIDTMGWTAKAVPGKQPELPFLSPEQTSVCDMLRKNPDATVNDLCASLGIPYARLSALLFEMEMDNVVCSLPGGRYGIINPDV